MTEHIKLEMGYRFNLVSKRIATITSRLTNAQEWRIVYIGYNKLAELQPISDMLAAPEFTHTFSTERPAHPDRMGRKGWEFEMKIGAVNCMTPFCGELGRKKVNQMIALLEGNRFSYEKRAEDLWGVHLNGQYIASVHKHSLPHCSEYLDSIIDLPAEELSKRIIKYCCGV